jgi:4-hydroxy-tetrahydrodipicolinate synthase
VSGPRPAVARPRSERLSVYVISITPFAGDGSFDEEATRSHLRRMAAGGVGVYLGGGGSGEGYVLSRPETLRLLEIGVEELRGKVPVRAMGVEPRSAAEMVEFIGTAAATGVEAVQVYSLDPGHGHRPTMDEVHRYFGDVLGQVAVPAVLSTHQSVGYQVPVSLLVDLAKMHPHLTGVNCSHQDLGYLAALADALTDRLELHVGGPQLGLTALALGANGFLSSEANLAPRLCAEVVGAAGAGDAHRALDRFGRLLRLSGALYGAGGIRATKAVLGALGLPGGVPRLPQLPVPADRLAPLLALVEELGLAELEGWGQAPS